MSKYERIIKVPAVVISRLTAEQIAELMHELAERRVTVELETRLRETHRQSRGSLAVFSTFLPPSSQGNEDDSVRQYVNAEPYRDLLRPTYGDRYTFLSPNGSVQFLYDDFDYEDIPRDVSGLIAEAAGPQGEVLTLNAKAYTQVLDLVDPNVNRVLIQGQDRAWVNDVYERLRAAMDASKEPARHLVYHWMLLFVWLTFLVAILLEYKIIRLASGFRWNIPLNGLQLLFAFGLMAIALIGSSQGFVRLLPFLFPYFELEGNLSRRRKTWRKPVVVAVVALYGAAVTLLFAVK